MEGERERAHDQPLPGMGCRSRFAVARPSGLLSWSARQAATASLAVAFSNAISSSAFLLLDPPYSLRLGGSIFYWRSPHALPAASVTGSAESLSLPLFLSDLRGEREEKACSRPEQGVKS